MRKLARIGTLAAGLIFAVAAVGTNLDNTVVERPGVFDTDPDNGASRNILNDPSLTVEDRVVM